MSEPAIRVENLGKVYRIGGPVERYRTFRDSVAQSFARAGRRLRSWFGGGNGAAPKYETIWALKDVSFEIQPGEVVGVIGRNGAGKSTLLKILSRITEPTEGRAVVRGRVGSLLEVGTGFHPELTGRENVYLNGAILGMKRAEVDRKFDEIVAFAEIEKFIDTPVKHYSSGMYVRLAFSVAAHLDTDILLVDEVLSVGDVKFQQKCMGRMQDRTFVGKTILFVSHNLPAVGGFCGRTLLLEGGRVAAFDSTHSVLPLYLGAETVSACEDLTGKPRARKGFGGVGVFRRIRLASHGSPTSCFRYGEPFEVIVDTRFPEECKGLTANLGVAITDPMGNVVLGLGTREFGKSPEVQAGEMQFRATVKRLLLMPGRYFINLYMDYTGRDIEAIERAIAFEVAWAPVDGVVRPPIAGVFFYPADWEVVAGNRA